MNTMVGQSSYTPANMGLTGFDPGYGGYADDSASMFDSLLGTQSGQSSSQGSSGFDDQTLMMIALMMLLLLSKNQGDSSGSGDQSNSGQNQGSNPGGSGHSGSSPTTTTNTTPQGTTTLTNGPATTTTTTQPNGATSTTTKTGGDPAKTASKTENISGTGQNDKTVFITNGSDKPMTVYHTGGEGGGTKGYTIPPGQTTGFTVGDNTNGAFTKGDANGAFTSDSGRIEYSVAGGKMSANLGSECGVDGMSLQAGQYSKSVDDVAANAPANLKDANGRLLEPKSNPAVQAYLDSIPGYANNSYTHWNSDTQTNVMEAAMLDVGSVSGTFS